MDALYLLFLYKASIGLFLSLVTDGVFIFLNCRWKVKDLKCYPWWPTVCTARFLLQLYSDWENTDNCRNTRITEFQELSCNNVIITLLANVLAFLLAPGHIIQLCWKYISVENNLTFDILFVFKRCLTAESKKQKFICTKTQPTKLEKFRPCQYYVVFYLDLDLK